MVINNNYRLQHDAEMALVTADNWHDKVVSGSKLFMSVVIQLPSEPRKRACPTTETVTTAFNDAQEMSKWYGINFFYLLTKLSIYRH